MSKAVKFIAGVAIAVVGVITGNISLIITGVSMAGSALLTPSTKSKAVDRNAAAQTLQLGEIGRQAIMGRACTAGSLVDAFNHGGQYGTDWETLVIAIADHRCDALEGFYVNDTYVAFAGDGAVAGHNNQLQVFWRDGQWGQSPPAWLTTNGPGWTANDRGRSVAYVVAAYKADAANAQSPVWPGGRPRLRWVVRGLRCYQARKDSSVGGAGTHRRDNPATWEWTENPIDCRYNWVRGIYAGDQVAQPAMLLVGRGLSAIEAPPANVFARANLCDEIVGGAARYRIGGVINATEPYIDVESDIAAACAGVIVQPEGAVEIDPGEARAPVAHFTDDDLLVGSTAKWSEFLGSGDDSWVNTVVANYADPSQGWQPKSAPVQRDIADVAADGGPREQQMRLDLVSWGAQAQRIAQIARRFGRLWGRAQVTLPPRFCAIEEGDWVTWQSARRFGGATRTFRVEAWGSNPAWHHQLTLRQISASVYSDTAPLADGTVAAQQPAPPALAAPAPGSWAAAAGYLSGGGVRTPAIIVTGTAASTAGAVRIAYLQDAPGAVWTDAALLDPGTTRHEIPLAADASYSIGVSHVVDGVTGPRLIIGPIAVGGATYPDGTPIEDLQPGEPAADLTLILQPATVSKTLQFTYDNQPKGGFPFDINLRAIAGGSTDVTDDGDWTATLKSGVADFAIGADTGTLHVDDYSANSVIEVVFALGAKTRKARVELLQDRDGAPSTGSSGAGTSASGSISQSGVGSGYTGTPAGPVLTCKAGSAGEVALGAGMEFFRSIAGTSHAAGKWQWRVVGGTWADVTTETGSDAPAVRSGGTEPFNEAGSLSVSAVKSGLTNGTSYEFQLLVRTISGTCQFSGSEIAVGG